MKLLHRDTDVTEVREPAGPAQGYGVLPDVPDFACPSCGAGMEAGQDWCLECGSAAPGRLGAKPGWRAALTVTSVTVLLVLGAVLAAYAAMTTDATRETRDGQSNGTPIQADVPPPPAPAAPTNTPPPPTTEEAPTVPAPKAGGSDSESEPIPSGGGGGGGASVAPSGGGASPAPSGGGVVVPAPGGSSGGGGSSAPAPKPVGAIALAAGSGSVYDPSERSGARFSDPTGAYDGTKSNGFTISAPGDGKPFGAGIAFRLEDPRELTSLEIATTTEGFTVEVYGSSSGTRPPDILDNRWVNLGRRTDVKDGAKIALDSDEVNRVRHVAVWIAAVPPGTGNQEGSSRRTVNLSELRFRGR